MINLNDPESPETPQKFKLPRRKMMVFRLNGPLPEHFGKNDALRCTKQFRKLISRPIVLEHFRSTEDMCFLGIRYKAVRDTSVPAFKNEELRRAQFRRAHLAVICIIPRHRLLFVELSAYKVLEALLCALRCSLLHPTEELEPIPMDVGRILELPKSDRTASASRPAYRYIRLKKLYIADSGYDAEEGYRKVNGDGFDLRDLLNRYPVEIIRRIYLLASPSFAGQRPFAVEMTNEPGILFAALRGRTIDMLAELIRIAEIPEDERDSNDDWEEEVP